jgi:hypothetical protein
VTKPLPPGIDELLDYRFPDALDLVYVRHSDEAFTITLMNADYKHFTFRMTLSLDGRWSLVPLAGFEDNTLW